MRAGTREWWRAVAASGLLLLPAAGCGGGGERARPAGSALWVDGEAPPLTPAVHSRLEAAGIGELFAEAATVRWSDGQPTVAPLRPVTAPGRARGMLVARGDWPPGELPDTGAAARTLAGGLDAIRRILGESGWSVSGWHLDLAGPPSVELLRELRDALDERLLLSIGLDRDGLAGETVEDLLAETDFVACFLYGVREGEPDRDAAWDFRQVERSARTLDALGEPFLVGVVVQGTATHLDGGKVVADLAGVGLADLAWNPGLRLRHGFSLAGVDRQVYEFAAPGPARVGPAQLATGDAVRVVGTSSAHVQELRRQLAGWGLQHRLGELYYKLPHAGDTLSLSPENLLRAGGAERPAPRPQVTIVPVAASRDRELVRVVLANAGAEPSDLGQMESNFVELRATGGWFADVDPGQFQRYDLLAASGGGGLRRNIRNPTVLRLFAPYLAPGARLESGTVLVRTAGQPAEVQVSATFLAPYGGSAEFGPRSWRELAPRPAATPGPAR